MLVVGDQSRQCSRLAMLQNLAEPVEAAAVHGANGAPALGALQVGRLEIHCDPLADPQRNVGKPGLQPAVEGDLVRGFVDHGGHHVLGFGLGQHLIDFADRTAPARGLAQRVDPGQIVHGHAVAAQAVVADDRRRPSRPTRAGNISGTTRDR